MLLVGVASCVSPGERARCVKDLEAARRSNVELQRVVAEREATVAALHRRIQYLQGFGPDRPADLFSPHKIEIVSRSGGSDFDGVPGDDGVTVYVRLRDADGDIVKAPGRITVQLLDNTELDAPKVLGIYRFDDVDRLRQAWYGRFGTQHYTLPCPFPAGSKPPERVDAKVEFVDYLTGRTLTAGEELAIALSGRDG